MATLAHRFLNRIQEILSPDDRISFTQHDNSLRHTEKIKGIPYVFQGYYYPHASWFVLLFRAGESTDYIPIGHAEALRIFRVMSSLITRGIETYNPRSITFSLSLDGHDIKQKKLYDALARRIVKKYRLPSSAIRLDYSGDGEEEYTWRIRVRD